MDKFQSAWREEMRSACIYKQMSIQEPVEAHRTLFGQLATEAEFQAGIWQQQGRTHGATMPDRYQPDLRTRVVLLLLRKLGARRMQPLLAAIKIRGLSVYRLPAPQDEHATPQTIADVGMRHRNAGTSGGLRAAVFGVNDGLVSIACLVMGVAGAAATVSTILMTGVAGLLAGAFSMAAGEYISMRSQREMFEYQIGLERDELAQYPEQEARELQLIYQARGLNESEAQALAQRMVADPEKGLDALAREELGLNPDELGSPWAAAFSSFLAFTFGGLVPLLPYLLGGGAHALTTAIVLTALALFGIGAALSLFTGRNAWQGGLRMLLIGGAAGAMTYWIGSLLGTSVL
ncbi:MAG TPA: VIT1/CCC1 transporter family protein [Methylovorus sp.]|jgi:vacuolar iron transporter family protein|nr:VIT1/CCC1 transporter family protein [Methylovorus sp.]